MRRAPISGHLLLYSLYFLCFCVSVFRSREGAAARHKSRRHQPSIAYTKKPTLSRASHISHPGRLGESVTTSIPVTSPPPMTSQHHHTGLSPIASQSSSTSCIPKSSSSTGPGPMSEHWPADYNLQPHGQTREAPHCTQCLTEIDIRLEAINE